ncbi:MAG: hypothetical protein A4E49_03368 [Methanosaeta sp. PtaU1.Bin112]|nr:MAG: hypothetical protein A4E49_03368 [Methanosaeta sp. PtaU1.Bin112]
MREFNLRHGLLGAAIIAMIINLAIISINSAQTFPLYGDNEITNATVYGIMKYEYGDGLYVDISADDSDRYDVELIDSENRTYNGNSGPYRSELHGFPTETDYKGSIRDMLLFDVPDETIIKGIRIVPSQSAPFYINWTEMPEITGENATLRFYGATFEPNGMRWRQGNWNLDISINNIGNHTAKYNSSSFALMDQFGWIYSGEEGEELKEIPAGESLRFTVKVPFVSELSDPIAILFKGLNLDISAWTIRR